MGAFSGTEALAEGPLNRKNGGSFTVAYRYSFVELASAAGLNVGTAALPRYRDMTFNADFGTTKAGRFALFGSAGQSSIDFLAAELDTTDLFANPDENAYTTSKFGVLGLKHSLLPNDRSYICTVLSASYSGNTYVSDDLLIEPRRVLPLGRKTRLPPQQRQAQTVPDVLPRFPECDEQPECLCHALQHRAPRGGPH